MNSLMALLPLAVIVAAALVVLMLEAFWGQAARRLQGYVGLAFLLACGAACVRSWNKGYTYFGKRLSLDNLALILIGLLLLAAVFVILVALKYIEIRKLPAAEFFVLLLLAVSGAAAMVSTNSLLIVFLGLEILSVSSYGLAGLHFEDLKSTEAAAKYFLLGSLASAVLVFGLALVYGAGRSLDIAGLAAALHSGSVAHLAAVFGLGLVVVGLGFKVALVPFHMWTPDVYEGAPTPATTFFSVGPKVAGFGALVRIFAGLVGPGDRGGPFFWVISSLAVLTMVVGTLAALRQSNIKRLLAYSSIAHAGYAAVGLAAGDYAAVVFYLAAYLFMGLGAFAAVSALSREESEFHDLEDLAGLGFKYPWLGAAFSAFLLSLAGFPPLAGFLGKFYIFSAAVRQNLLSLAIVGVLTSLISVYFYLRVIVFLYMREPSRPVEVVQENPGLFLTLFLCLYGILQLGINPANVLVLIRKAVAGF